MAEPTSPIERVAVIMPTYEERQNLEAVAGRLRAAVPYADLLVVDDNSPMGPATWPTSCPRSTRTSRSCTGPTRPGWARLT